MYTKDSDNKGSCTPVYRLLGFMPLGDDALIKVTVQGFPQRSVFRQHYLFAKGRCIFSGEILELNEADTVFCTYIHKKYVIWFQRIPCYLPALLLSSEGGRGWLSRENLNISTRNT